MYSYNYGYVICNIAGVKGDQGDTGLMGPKGDPGKLIEFTWSIILHFILNQFT